MVVIVCCKLSMFDTVAITFLQTRIDKEYMGRVLGIITMFNSSLMPLGMLLFGPLEDQIEIKIILIGCGIVIMLVALSIVMSSTLKTVEV